MWHITKAKDRIKIDIEEQKQKINRLIDVSSAEGNLKTLKKLGKQLKKEQVRLNITRGIIKQIL